MPAGCKPWLGALWAPTPPPSPGLPWLELVRNVVGSLWLVPSPSPPLWLGVPPCSG